MCFGTFERKPTFKGRTQLVERQSNQQAVPIKTEEFALKADLQNAMARIDELEKLCREGA